MIMMEQYLYAAGFATIFGFPIIALEGSYLMQSAYGFPQY